MVDGGKGLTEAIRTVEGFAVKREYIEVDKGTCERVCRETKQWFNGLLRSSIFSGLRERSCRTDRCGLCTDYSLGEVD